MQQGALEKGDTALARVAISLLRQLASSDAVKSAIVNADGLQSLKIVLAYSADASQAIVAEPALGLLANLALRNPEVSKAAAECGCAVEAVRAMREMLVVRQTEVGGKEGVARATGALRQGCMAIRNMSARCPEAKEELLNAGAESVVREIKAAAPAACQDVASAALRDFGLDDYH